MTEQDILDLLQPETELERRLILHPTIREGLQWGEPRYGHPEGKVVYHIADIFENRWELALAKAKKGEVGDLVQLLRQVDSPALPLAFRC